MTFPPDTAGFSIYHQITSGVATLSSCRNMENPVFGFFFKQWQEYTLSHVAEANHNSGALFSSLLPRHMSWFTMLSRLPPDLASDFRTDLRGTKMTSSAAVSLFVSTCDATLEPSTSSLEPCRGPVSTANCPPELPHPPWHPRLALSGCQLDTWQLWTYPPFPFCPSGQQSPDRQQTIFQVVHEAQPAVRLIPETRPDAGEQRHAT